MYTLSLIILFTISSQWLHAQSEAPYPPSPVIETIQWQPAHEVLRLATGSDIFPITWADDDWMYTAYGDGWGFLPFVEKKLSMGISRIQGIPPDIHCENIRTESGEATGDGARGRKASGMLMVDGILYMLVRNVDNSQLGWSEDYGKTWTWADWKFSTGFGCPTFLNYGKNYANARDQYVYIYSHDSDSAYHPADRMVLARVPKDRLKDREAYEFLQTLDERQQPVWTKNMEMRGAVFKYPGYCYRSGISYNPYLRRYLWCQTIPDADVENLRSRGGLGIFDAPEPWGPWTTVFHAENWDIGPGETSSFPSKWYAKDGKSAYLVFSGNDSFSVRKASFVLRGQPEKTQQTARVTLQNNQWHINGSITYPDAPAEGLLMNVRMVNATFEICSG